MVTLGVDHRSAPTAIREALAFNDARRNEGLDHLRRIYPGCEFVILSTCNRVEISAGAFEPACVPGLEHLEDFLGQFHNLDLTSLAAHVVGYLDEGAVGHLFRVAASLESLVLGEGQILAQLKSAYEAARKRGTVGTLLNPIFQHALHVGKKVRDQTGLDHGKLSVASVAVEVAQSVFSQFHDKTVLVLGAGKMAELTLQHLAPLKLGRILVVNRSPERAQATAARWRGQAWPWAKLDDALIEADLVISTTSANQKIVNHNQYAFIQKLRRNRLSLILDIAIPRDFDHRVGEIDRVLLYNVDDLQAQADRNRRARRRHIEHAQAIIDQETEEILRKVRHQHHAGVALRSLDQRLDEVIAGELNWLLSKHPDLAEHRGALDHFTHRLKNKFLHAPRTALRNTAPSPIVNGHPDGLVQAIRDLFSLEEAKPGGEGQA